MADTGGAEVGAGPGAPDEQPARRRAAIATVVRGKVMPATVLRHAEESQDLQESQRQAYGPDMETPHDRPEQDPWLLPGEAAALLGVSTTTLAAWADAGRIDCLRLPSGHRRYLAESVHALAAKGGDLA